MQGNLKQGKHKHKHGSGASSSSRRRKTNHANRSYSELQRNEYTVHQGDPNDCYPLELERQDGGTDLQVHSTPLLH